MCLLWTRSCSVRAVCSDSVWCAHHTWDVNWSVSSVSPLLVSQPLNVFSEVSFSSSVLLIWEKPLYVTMGFFTVVFLVFCCRIRRPLHCKSNKFSFSRKLCEISLCIIICDATRPKTTNDRQPCRILTEFLLLPYYIFLFLVHIYVLLVLLEMRSRWDMPACPRTLH